METVEILGCTCEVVERYALSDEYMKEHDLSYRNRIKVRNLESGEIMDFANTTNI